MDHSRRDFLVQSSQAAGVAFLAANLGSLTFPFAAQAQNSPDTPHDFHLHPHYRTQTALETTLRKTKAGLDEFVTEKYADQIGAVLDRWSAALLQSPRDLRAFADALGLQFAAAPLRPIDSRQLRSGNVQSQRRTFSSTASLGREAFLPDLHATTDEIGKFLTAEFQLTSIREKGSDHVATHVRYEFVGSNSDFHRVQRVGEWEIEWTHSPAGEWRISRWMALGETMSRAAAPVFADISAPALGASASYAHQLLHGSDYWRARLDGASGIDVYGHNGVSVGDIDNDGFDDLYVCQPAGLPNRLYRNRGDGTFDDITEASGLGVLENTACALFADIDNDGRQDVIIVRSTGPLLFLNQGDGRFRQSPGAFHFTNTPQGTFTGAAIADYDRDGWLDIYFCLYAYYQGADQYRYPTPYHDAENGPPNFMMRNNRDGTFRDVTAETGLTQNNTRYSFCCGWGDYDRDGWPDLYVVNDFGRKNLYRNNGDGTFSDVAAEAGVEDIGAGMSACWLDHDNRGSESLYVANMWTAAGQRISEQDLFQKDASTHIKAMFQKHTMGNALLRNDGGIFRDGTNSAGVGNGRWAWSSDAWDFDHDGSCDLYVANGMVTGPSTEDVNSFFWRQVVANSPQGKTTSHSYEQGWNAVNEWIRADGTWSGRERNVFYANNGDGTFSDVSGAVGLDFLEDGRAFALADFDHDGRLEVFLKNRNGPQLRVLKNVQEKLPASISFRIRGVKSNRDAIGAAVTIETDTGRQTKMLQAGSGFLSQHTKEIFFGLGDAKKVISASVRWPSGLVQKIGGLPLNHRIWIEEGSEPTRREPFLQPVLLKTLTTASQDLDQAAEDIQTWLLAPITAPDFSLPDQSGKITTLSSLRSKPVLLNFWISGSEVCERDLDLFGQQRDSWAKLGLQLLAVNCDDERAAAPNLRYAIPILQGSEDVTAVYNILYRYLFDLHRELRFPTSFLVDALGEIVKVYQGAAPMHRIEEDFQNIPRSATERVTKGLPFPGTNTFEFGRNYLSYGTAFFEHGYYGQAGVYFASALRDAPSSAEALYGVGSAFLRQNKTADARESFKKVITLRAAYPDTLPNAWNNLGILETREGRMNEAADCFRKAIELNPDHLIALDNLGNAYRELKRWDEARAVLQRAVKIGPEDAEANYNLGMVYAQTDDTVNADKFLHAALKYRPIYPEALNNLGILSLRTQHRDQAVANFEECIRIAPEFDRAYLNLARVYSVEGQPSQARVVLLQLLKLHPGHEEAVKMMGSLEP